MSQYFEEYQKNIQKEVISEDKDFQYRQEFAYIISCMETYFFQAFFGTLEKYPSQYNKLAESKYRFNTIKIDTFSKLGLDGVLKKELDNFIFHNIPQVKILFKEALDIDWINDFDDIAKAVKKRHDIVHRCGLNKDSIIVKINQNDISKLKEKVLELIKYIDIQIDNIYT